MTYHEQLAAFAFVTADTDVALVARAAATHRRDGVEVLEVLHLLGEHDIAIKLSVRPEGMRPEASTPSEILASWVNSFRAAHTKEIARIRVELIATHYTPRTLGTGRKAPGGRGKKRR